jgi:hypothetical protein
MVETAMMAMMEMMAMGIELDSEEMQKATAPESLQQLPEIEGFFRKDYRSMIEEWATHQMSVDEERFKMQELEERGFRDMLITDLEFLHFIILKFFINILVNFHWIIFLSFY